MSLNIISFDRCIIKTKDLKHILNIYIEIVIIQGIKRKYYGSVTVDILNNFTLVIDKLINYLLFSLFLNVEANTDVTGDEYVLIETCLITRV